MLRSCNRPMLRCRRRLLVFASRLRARARPRLPRRVSLRREPVRAAARRTRAAAGAAVRARRVVSRRAQPVLRRADRYRLPRRGVARRRAVDRRVHRHGRIARARWPARACGPRCGCSISPSSTSGRPSTRSAGKHCCSKPGSSRSSSAAHTTLPSMWMIWIWRWMLFRLMFGAGLIKLRGDPCWRNLTCLDYYFETQPMPNPLSWYFHWLPPVRPSRRRRVQSRRRAGRAVRVFRAAAVRRDRRPRHDRVSTRADRERQPVVAELAHDRARHSHAGRSLVRVAADRRSGAHATRRRAASRHGRGDGARRRAQHPPDPQHDLAGAR